MVALILQTPLIANSAEVPPTAGKAAPGVPAPVKLFPILEYRVQGNTVLPPVDVERAVMPYLGVSKSIKDVEAARLNLEKAYHVHGYQTVLVNIPQQEVSAGIVRLQVIEAPVGRFEIKGSRYHSLQVIRATVPELEPGSTPNFIEVQKELAQLNHTQDLHVTPVLRASTTPGQVDVDLDVQDELPLHAMLEVNNRYSANTAHIRTIGEVSYDNLFQSNQSASIQYQTAPEHPENAKIWSLSYVKSMRTRLSIQTCSPIHVWSPMARFQGYLMLTRGLMMTPRPILAPNRRSSHRFGPETGIHQLSKTIALTRYQMLRRTIPAPVS